MKALSLLAGAAVVAGVISGPRFFARAGDAPATARVVKLGNATCPVKGTPVDAKVTAVWNDLEVGFCCPECPKQFASNPNAYTAALLRDLATQLADAKARLAKYEKPPAVAPPPVPATPPAAPALVDLGNAMCPVMPTMAAKPTVFVDYHGMRVHFCCRMCPPKFNAKPQEYLKSLRSDPATAKRIDDAEAAWAAAHPDGR